MREVARSRHSGASYVVASSGVTAASAKKARVRKYGRRRARRPRRGVTGRASGSGSCSESESEDEDLASSSRVLQAARSPDLRSFGKTSAR
ncbi:hypothetical protein [Streptomyces atratus]|uniref:hypothetical protein n=1 Tax=Streptomyces atratus TaxID=1893 RepID=UPI003244819F